MSDATDHLSNSDPEDTAKLLSLLYDELRKLAAAKIAKEKPGQTLQATALVHEVFVRLSSEPQSPAWKSRRQFFAAAAEAMRRILVESARRKKSQKHGGNQSRCDVDLEQFESQRPAEEVLALHEALDALAEQDPQKAELVKLRYFVGLSITEAAEVLEVSPSTIDRQWAYARAWLHRHISEDELGD